MSNTKFEGNIKTIYKTRVTTIDFSLTQKKIVFYLKNLDVMSSENIARYLKTHPEFLEHFWDEQKLANKE